MTKHLHRDLDQVHRDILALSATVEEMIDKAARAFRDRQFDLADELSGMDEYVDQQEVQIEEECLKMLALHQPVAADLRRISTVLKVNNDLERIADLTVSVAQRARSVCDYPEFKIPDRVDQIVTKATKMVHEVMDAFVNLDNESARKVMTMDDEVDQLNVAIIQELERVMQQSSGLVVPALHCFSATRHFERIGDLATNIAEDVIYLVEGEIVRHRKSDSDLLNA